MSVLVLRDLRRDALLPASHLCAPQTLRTPQRTASVDRRPKKGCLEHLQQKVLFWKSHSALWRRTGAGRSGAVLNDGCSGLWAAAVLAGAHCHGV